MATTLCLKPGKCLLQALGPVNLTRSRLICAVGPSGELGSLVTLKSSFFQERRGVTLARRFTYFMEMIDLWLLYSWIIVNVPCQGRPAGPEPLTRNIYRLVTGAVTLTSPGLPYYYL